MLKIFLGVLSEIGTLCILTGSHGTKKILKTYKTFIWGFKQSFLSPCSLKAFYDLFSPQILLFAQIPPNVTTQTLITFHEKIFENFFLVPWGPARVPRVPISERTPRNIFKMGFN